MSNVHQLHAINHERCQLVQAFQTIISRNLDPQQPAVLTVGAIEAGRDNNVIPASATLELSVRALDQALGATPAALLAGGGMLAAAALHVAWGRGSSFPAPDRAVAGAPSFEGNAPARGGGRSAGRPPSRSNHRR